MITFLYTVIFRSTKIREFYFVGINFVATLPVIEGDGVTLGEAGPQLAQHLLVPVLTKPDHLIHNTCTRHTHNY
jgi:hypothetical protein